MPKPSQEEFAGWIVEFLQLGQNRPRLIERTDYVRCHLCKVKHGGFLINDFDSKNQVFTIVHGDKSGQSGKIVRQTPSELQKYLTQCFQRGHIKLKELRKKIDVTEFEKSYTIIFRVTKREKMLLEEESSKKNITISQYVRSKIFSTINLDYNFIGLKSIGI